MQIWWKNPYIIGNVAHWFIRSLARTMRIKMHKDVVINHGKPYLFAFWHGKQFLPGVVIAKHHLTDMYVTVSPSRDGSMLAVTLKKIGYGVVRGSSRDQNVKVLIDLKNKVNKGASIGFAIDGPIGPMHVGKPGIVFLAKKCGIPIIPMGSAVNRYWTFKKAWDKFQLPKPFSKGVVFLDEPFVVPADMDIQQGLVELERRVHLANQRAEELL